MLKILKIDQNMLWQNWVNLSPEVNSIYFLPRLFTAEVDKIEFFPACFLTPFFSLLQAKQRVLGKFLLQKYEGFMYYCTRLLDKKFTKTSPFISKSEKFWPKILLFSAKIFKNLKLGLGSFFFSGCFAIIGIFEISVEIWRNFEFFCWKK